MCTNTAKRSERWLARRKRVTLGWGQEHVGDRPPQAGRLTWQTKKMNLLVLMTCRLFFTVTTVGSLWTQQTPQKWQELAPNTVIISLRSDMLHASACVDCSFHSKLKLSGVYSYSWLPTCDNYIVINPSISALSVMAKWWSIIKLSLGRFSSQFYLTSTTNPKCCCKINL